MIGFLILVCVVNLGLLVMLGRKIHWMRRKLDMEISLMKIDLNRCEDHLIDHLRRNEST